MSTRETILAAVATTLAGVASGRIYRRRQEQIETLPAVEVEFAGAVAGNAPIGVADHELRVRVAVLAKGDTPETAADATLVLVHSALLAAINLGLGTDVQIDPDNWTADEPEISDYDYIRQSHIYTVRYRTAFGGF